MKKSILLILTIVMVFSFTGCGQEAIYTAGTYEGEAEGLKDAIKVEVIVSKTEILEINVTQMNETASVAENPVKDTVSNILSNQNTEVDTVSGATIATEGVINAVESALAQARIQ